MTGLRPGEVGPIETYRHRQVDELARGDRIHVYDGWGEVIHIRGPHGPLGTPPTTDWYTLRVQFDGNGYATAVGPKRGNVLVAVE